MGRKRGKHKGYPPRLHQKGNSLYHVGNPVSDPQSGKLKRTWTKVGTTDDMPAALEQWALLERCTQSLDQNSLSAVAQRYADLIAHPDNPLRLAASTGKEFCRMLRVDPPSTLVVAFGHMHIDAIKPHHIGDYLDQHPAPTAANREISLLSRIYRWAIRRGIVTQNPCLGIEKNPEARRDRYPEDWEYLAVREFCRSFTNGNGVAPWKALAFAMDISYLTSFREGDVIRIKIGDYDDQFLKIREGKTGWKAHCPVTPELRAVIEQARKDLRRRVTSFYLLTNRNGLPFSSSGFKSAWQRMMREAIKRSVITEKFTFHDIRAKHATDKDEQGLNAQLALGHTDPSMTARYIRSRKGRKIEPLRAIIVEEPRKIVEDGD